MHLKKEYNVLLSVRLFVVDLLELTTFEKMSP